MTRKEEFLACLRREPHDGVPSFVFDLSFGTQFAGYGVSEIYRGGFDGRKSAESIRAGWEYLGHDAVPGSMACFDTRVFGSEFTEFEDRPPMTRKHAFSDPSKLYDHSVGDIEHPSYDGIIESANLVKRMCRDAAVLAYVPSPFLLAATLRGVEAALMDLMTEKEYFSDLMSLCSDVCMRLTERHVNETGCDGAVIPGAYDNPDIVGAETVKKVCLPPLSKMYGLMKESDMPVVFHPHGRLSLEENAETLNDCIAVGFECIYYGEDCDHRAMCRLADGRVSLMGGIDTNTTILLGTDAKVAEDTKNVLDQTAGCDFLFSCSCSVDRGLDPRKLKLMMDTVKSY